MAANVRVESSESRAVVPASALIEGEADAASVYVIEAGAQVARRVTVRVEALLGAEAYLAAALPSGAQVVAVQGAHPWNPMRPGGGGVPGKRPRGR